MDWAAAIAGYAAGVSTLVAARQLLVDLPRVTVTVVERGQVYGGPPGTPPRDAISVTITNAGRRPAIITSVAFMPPKRGWIGLPYPFVEQTPFTLREGEYKALLLYRDDYKPGDRPPPDASVWFAQDSVGHTWPRSARVRLRLRRLGNWWRKMTKGEDPWDAANRLYAPLGQAPRRG